MKTKTYPTPSHFYRLRNDEANYGLSKGELFHIPFHKRGNVSTMRYSIPGFPCLYLADSVYVAWEELRRPSLSKIQAVRLENILDIKVLDVTTDIYMGEDAIIDALSPDELWTHLLVWPLIAACSIKVPDPKVSFKPEYIIPQLLLQIVRTNDDLQGIMFSSTHIDRNKIPLKGSFVNFAIPVKENSDNGYCNTLLSCFNSTPPVPWEIGEVFSKRHITGMFLGAGSMPPKCVVDSIQLISGKDIPYGISTFGQLEKILLELDAEPIHP